MIEEEFRSGMIARFRLREGRESRSPDILLELVQLYLFCVVFIQNPWPDTSISLVD